MFIISTFFPLLHEVLYTSHVKLFAEALECFMHTVLQCVVTCKTVSLECILQEVKEMKVRVY